MKSTRAAALVAVVWWMGWTAPAHSAVEVNTCGQRFSGDGFLSADLDCSGYVGTPIEIDGNGSLDLRGFTITAQNVATHPDGAYAVFCDGSCSIYGGGGTIIANGTPDSGNYVAAVFSEGNIFVTDLTLRESNYLGIRANGKAEVINSTLADNHQGIGANRSLRVTNSSVTGNGWGASAGGSVSVRGRALLTRCLDTFPSR